MEEKNGLSKQLQILSLVKKNEDKFKIILFVVVIMILLSSTLLTLSFSYKAYKKVENIIIDKKINEEEKISYETLSVSYENGNVISCNNSECGNVVINLTNDGEEDLSYSISFMDGSGDATNYMYEISSSELNKKGNAVTGSEIITENIKIKAGQSLSYKISMEALDMYMQSSYQVKLLVNINNEDDSLLR